MNWLIETVVKRVIEWVTGSVELSSNVAADLHRASDVIKYLRL